MFKFYRLWVSDINGNDYQKQRKLLSIQLQGFHRNICIARHRQPISSMAVSPLFVYNTGPTERWVPDQCGRFWPARRVPGWPGGYQDTRQVFGNPVGIWNSRREAEYRSALPAQVFATPPNFSDPAGYGRAGLVCIWSECNAKCDFNALSTASLFGNEAGVGFSSPLSFIPVSLKFVSIATLSSRASFRQRNIASSSSSL